MKYYDTVIFDLDGTLSNSKEGITKCVQYALSKVGIKEENLDSLEHFIGPPLYDEFIKTYGFSDEKSKEAVAYYRQRYEPEGIYEASLYDGVEEMLKNLKEEGKIIALATSKPIDMAKEVLRHFNIINYFDYIMGAQRVGPRQSKTAVLEALLGEMKDKNRDKMVMVGDTCYDVEGAKNVGVDCIGVNYGFGTKEEMLKSGAMAVADTTEQLTDILKGA